MDLELDDDQVAVADAFGRLFDVESTPSRVRAAEAHGFDPALWDRLVEMGGPVLAVPESVGGGGGSLLDLALVVHAQGRRLGSVPLVESAVAARAVATSATLTPIDGPVLRGVALRPARDGVAVLVPAGAVADEVVALDGDELVLVSGAAQRRRDPHLTLAGCPVGDWWVGEDDSSTRRVLASGSSARSRWQRAVAEWQVLTASLLVGAGRSALDLAVGYVGERHQFGVPIGSFQTVAHRLADVAVGLDGAGLLAQHAAWCLDGERDPGTRAAMAFATAADVAEQAVKESLHFFGGYGFMLEYDIQLYFRRVKAWTLALGDPQREYQRVGESVLAGAPGRG
jgi:alkylation response protein AidB-like acyl-CoA dehydrogenase